MMQRNKAILIQILSCFYYHAYSFRYFTNQMRYMIIPIKFIINENTKKFGLVDLIDRMAVNPDIQLMPKFLSSKHHVMGLLDI